MFDFIMLVKVSDQEIDSVHTTVLMTFWEFHVANANHTLTMRFCDSHLDFAPVYAVRVDVLYSAPITRSLGGALYHAYRPRR